MIQHFVSITVSSPLLWELLFVSERKPGLFPSLRLASELLMCSNPDTQASCPTKGYPA